VYAFAARKNLFPDAGGLGEFMDIIVAYFHPLFHPEVVKQDFEQIRAAGANSILYTVHEQEEQRTPRDFERGFRLAREAGLKINLGLGRFGNLFAGPAQVPSWYTFRHPQSRVMDQHGRHHEMSCFNHQSFRSWMFREIERLLKNYPISGILVDEPGGLEVTCYCATCRALCPDVTDLARFRRRSIIEFLGELCAHVKQVNPQVKTTIVLRPQDVSLAEDLVSIELLDTLGCHLFWNILQENVAAIEMWGREIVEVTRQAGKRSQLWLQNFNIDTYNEAELETAFTQILSLEPDEVGCYYFWRNNADPARVWDISRRLLRRVPRRQMRWRVHTQSHPAVYPPVTLPSKIGPTLREKLVAFASTLTPGEGGASAEDVPALPSHASEAAVAEAREEVVTAVREEEQTPAETVDLTEEQPAQDVSESGTEADDTLREIDDTTEHRRSDDKASAPEDDLKREE
jgi:hypothetical protein